MARGSWCRQGSVTLSAKNTARASDLRELDGLAESPFAGGCGDDFLVAGVEHELRVGSHLGRDQRAVAALVAARSTAAGSLGCLPQLEPGAGLGDLGGPGRGGVFGRVEGEVGFGLEPGEQLGELGLVRLVLVRLVFGELPEVLDGLVLGSGSLRELGELVESRPVTDLLLDPGELLGGVVGVADLRLERVAVGRNLRERVAVFVAFGGQGL